MEITEVIRRGIITEKSVALQNLTRNVGRKGRGTVARSCRSTPSRWRLGRTRFRSSRRSRRCSASKVVKVNTMRMPGKARVVRTRKGMYHSEARPWKKAIVTLAEGQSIAELQA